MAKKYIKCPRCELNYILDGEDYCNVCKNEMKHHSESEEDEELLDFEDMDLCPICGQNYVKIGDPMCDECRKKRSGDDSIKNWDDDSMSSPVSDIDSEEDDDDYNSGFSEVDENGEEIDPFKETSLLDDDSPIDFESEEEEIEEDISETMKDDFEVVEVSDDEDDFEDEEDDDYDFEDDDLLGKKK